MSYSCARYGLLVGLIINLSPSYAASAMERAQLDLVTQQLDVAITVSERAESASQRSDRYRLDYPSLRQDMKRIRAGIHDYLSPSRAQPRDLEALRGEYRQDTAYEESSP